jgi:hypothetical protein
VRAAGAAVAAVGVVVFSILSVVISNIVGVVGSMYFQPEAMLDYVMPALGGALQQWLVPWLVVGAVSFLGFLLLRPTTRVRGVVGWMLLTAVAATLAVGAVTFIRIYLDYRGIDVSLELAHLLVAAGTTTAQSFLICAPLIMLAGAFLWIWQRRGGLTEGPVVE